MKKDLIKNVLIKLLGVMFGGGVSITGLLLFVFGIAFCTSVIGIVVGVPMIIYGIGLVFSGIISALESVFKGAEGLKFLNKNVKVEAEKFNFGNVKFVSLSPVVGKYELN